MAPATTTTTTTTKTAETTRPVAERRFRAMGTDCHVVIVGQPGHGGPGASIDVSQLVEGAVARIEELEARWSRFCPESEISLLNQNRSGRVSHDTFLLMERAVFAWQATGGRFNPTLAAQLSESGYDRSFAELTADTTDLTGEHRTVDPTTTVHNQPPAPTCAGVVLDAFTSTIWLPDGVNIDPGGIGKGLAADIVTGELIEVGADGALVNLGGDLRVRGHAPDGGHWLIDVREPMIADQPLTTLALPDGAVASSTPLRRAWTIHGADHHHLLNPTTATANLVAPDLVTVVSAEAWWAEVAATATASATPVSAGAGNGALVVLPPDRLSGGLSGAAVLRVDKDGTQTRCPHFSQYEQATRNRNKMEQSGGISDD